MLKYKNIRPLFIAAIVVMLACIRFLHLNQFYLLVPVVIYLGFIAYGAYFIQSGFFSNAVCKIQTRQNEIAITFDDGPNAAVTPKVLELLKAANAKATFFCIGKNIRGNEAILKQIAKDGHTIGNHSHSHNFFFDLYRDRRVEYEITSTNDEIGNLTGKKVIYFRPPFGVTNPVIARVAQKLNMVIVGWSIRSYDTTIKNPDTLFKRVTGNLKPGDIVLFHDSHPRILPVLKRFLDYSAEKGFKISNFENLSYTEVNQILK